MVSRVISSGVFGQTILSVMTIFVTVIAADGREVSWWWPEFVVLKFTSVGSVLSPEFPMLLVALVSVMTDFVSVRVGLSIF